MNLPLDIIKTIITLCDLRTFCKLMQTCKTIYKICKPMVIQRMDNYALEHQGILPNGNWHYIYNSNIQNNFTRRYINGHGIGIYFDNKLVIARCNHFNGVLHGVYELLNNNHVITRRIYKNGIMISEDLYPGQHGLYVLLLQKVDGVFMLSLIITIILGILMAINNA